MTTMSRGVTGRQQQQITHPAHHMLELETDRQGRERDTQAIHQCCFIKIFIHTMLLYVGSDPRG